MHAHFSEFLVCWLFSGAQFFSQMGTTFSRGRRNRPQSLHSAEGRGGTSSTAAGRTAVTPSGAVLQAENARLRNELANVRKPGPAAATTPVLEPVPTPAAGTDENWTGTIDLLVSDNAEAANTSAFETAAWSGSLANALVVRRAAPFFVRVTPPSGSTVSGANISLVQRSFADLPTRYELPLASASDGRFAVTVPWSAAIGVYDGEVRFGGGGVVACQVPIVLLANPWSEADDVYLADNAERAEYVLEESGLIWIGTSSSLDRVAWEYGQFDEGVLEAALELLKLHSRLDTSDVVQIARWLSCIVNASNSLDEPPARALGVATGPGGSFPGVLVGKWPSPWEFEGGSDPYADGTAPTAWNGSAPILLQWLQGLRREGSSGRVEAHTPVLYGRCWCFGGLVTALSRCLGIPARTLTNYDSAHDTTMNRMLDHVHPLDADGDIDFGTDLSHDSVWNFHVWNDLWFRRRDHATGGGGGWQAIDATPQERSGGLYRCGPASVAEVKAGERGDYDLDFVIAEVNADRRVIAVPLAGGAPDYDRAYVASVDTGACGKQISTKAVGRMERHDITHEYKYPEGTAANRASVLWRQKDFGWLKESSYTVPEDTFELRMSGSAPFAVGAPFGVNVTCKTDAGDDEWRCQLLVYAVSYAGGKRRLVKESRRNMIKGGQSAALQVSEEEYLPFLKETSYPFELRASCVHAKTDACGRRARCSRCRSSSSRWRRLSPAPRGRRRATAPCAR